MIYITGDCHSDFVRFNKENFPEQTEMTKGDYVIISGDFGGVWNVEYLYCLNANVLKLVERARSGMPFAANNVMQELALFLMMEEAEFVMDTMSRDME